MPQMAPMMWTLIYIYFLMIMMMFMMKMYFNKNTQMKSNMMYKSVENKYWKW
uniref:ATP synthase F0 subunit 8 n=1 Tax=Orestes mouhotii TaxID=590986 RepID=E2RUT4_9NEOP|nr:ATP synthase F0 subunit 8 [Orestes mouhotii]